MDHEGTKSTKKYVASTQESSQGELLFPGALRHGSRVLYGIDPERVLRRLQGEFLRRRERWGPQKEVSLVSRPPSLYYFGQIQGYQNIVCLILSVLAESALAQFLCGNIPIVRNQTNH